MCEVNLKPQLKTPTRMVMVFCNCKGEQVLLSYGVYTNLELLEHYGFILEENPNNKAFIPLETEMHSLCSWPQDSVYISQEGKPSFALLSTARLWGGPLNAL